MPCYVVEENVMKGKEVWRVENYPLAYIIRSLIKHVKLTSLFIYKLASYFFLSSKSLFK